MPIRIGVSAAAFQATSKARTVMDVMRAVRSRGLTGVPSIPGPPLRTSAVRLLPNQVRSYVSQTAGEAMSVERAADGTHQITNRCPCHRADGAG